MISTLSEQDREWTSFSWSEGDLSRKFNEMECPTILQGQRHKISACLTYLVIHGNFLYVRCVICTELTEVVEASISDFRRWPVFEESALSSEWNMDEWIIDT